MILLLGGTSETGPLALALAESGHSVLVSTATDARLDIGRHANVRRRSGPLDEAGLSAVVVEQAIRIIVDATHPYAVVASRTAHAVAARTGIPYLRFARPPVLVYEQGVLHAPDHETAAQMAVNHGRPVLLTIGSRNLGTYAARAREQGVLLVARVLDFPGSLAACCNANLRVDNVILGRGPFSVAQNREVIRRFGIGVLVTKDSGEEGGTRAKVQAADAEGCRVVVVDRPESGPGPELTSIEEVVRAVGVVGGAAVLDAEGR